MKSKNKKEIEVKNLDYKALSTEQIELELQKEKYKEKYLNILRSTIYALVIVAAVSTIIATLIIPVLQISGNSMNPTYSEGDIVLAYKTKKLKTGDIIAFYHGNKILVKRVIAGPSNYVDIDEDGNVYVNGILLEETYVEKKSLGESDIKYPYQVPDGKWFVMSDNRENLTDSRINEIGCISNENIVGKLFIRVWPFTKGGK